VSSLYLALKLEVCTWHYLLNECWYQVKGSWFRAVERFKKKEREKKKRNGKEGRNDMRRKKKRKREKEEDKEGLRRSPVRLLVDAMFALLFAAR
jgi:hypothetical protein